MVAFFTQVADGSFIGNDPARGPWSQDHCHAGPVSGLIARAAEALAGPERMLTRLTVDFLRPLPMAGMRIEALTGRDTRTLATTQVQVRGLDGTLCASATVMHLTRRAHSGMPTTATAAPVPGDAVPGSFPIRLGRHGLPMFADFAEVRLPPGEDTMPGPTVLWMRTPALLEGEVPSPVQALCPLADCGNAISRNGELDEYGFMNVDLTLQVHREPVSDWLASQAVSHWHDSGIGMSHAVLSDTEGPVAVALQTLVLRPVVAG
jgi:hypothetical protein